MSDIGKLQGVDLKSLGIAAPTNDKNNNELGQSEFLDLLITQLQNQDPLQPQENGEFITQMAQFGTVDGIKELQQSFSDFASSLQSNQALQASALVGRSVEVPSDFGIMQQNGNISGSVDLPSTVNNLLVSIHNTQGELVKQIEMGAQAAGNVPFKWDGIANDGKQVEPGKYTIKAEAFIDGSSTAFPTNISANVNSVTLGNGADDLRLNLAGMGETSISKVKNIN